MTASSETSKEMDQISEVKDDKKIDDDKKVITVEDPDAGKNTNASLPFTGIEGNPDDTCEQIAFMVSQLSHREKRKTLQLLGPDFAPLQSSTHMQVDESGHSGSDESRSKPAAASQDTLYTSGREVNLAPNTSVSKIVFQAPHTNLPKLRLFSGTEPVPKGEVDFRSWISAARRLKKREDLDNEEKCEKLQNSLLSPALKLVRSALDESKPGKVLSLLSKAYDDVKDVRDIRNEYHASVQLQTEQCSDFLTRLYLLLHEVNRKCEVDDFDGELLKQFIYGCNDDSLVLKLRLEEKDDMGDPPDYGSLLLSIRREEAKRTRKKPAPKARVQQLEVVDVQQEAETEATALKKEVESLRKEVAHLKQQRS